MNDNNVTYFDSFGVKYIPKEIKKLIGNKNIITNIHRIQACNSTMCGYFCIEFIDFMLWGRGLTDFRNLLPTSNFKENDKVILNFFFKLRYKNGSNIR